MAESQLRVNVLCQSAAKDYEQELRWQLRIQAPYITEYQLHAWWLACNRLEEMKNLLDPENQTA